LDTNLKRYEKESLLKSFSLFFLTLIFLNSIIFFLYYQEQKKSLHVEIFNKIKLYNYTFNDKNILVDIVPLKKTSELYSLHVKEHEIFSYFDIPSSKKNSLKIIYPNKVYQKELSSLKNITLLYFFISSIILMLLSTIYSLYAMKPLKDALSLLEEFLKDIIHDLNTPISSILLNLKILQKKKSEEAIKRIEYSAKNIGSLYNNIEITIKDEPIIIEEINIQSLIDEKIEYYSYLFPDIKFQTKIQTETLKTSHDAISRILDNLISNACKYNKAGGYIHIFVNEDKIVIEDSGVGIKNINRVFERFYKENDRGIGIGLNIVKKLCKKLGYAIEIQSKLDIGTKIKVTLR